MGRGRVSIDEDSFGYKGAGRVYGQQGSRDIHVRDQGGQSHRCCVVRFFVDREEALASAGGCVGVPSAGVSLPVAGGGRGKVGHEARDGLCGRLGAAGVLDSRERECEFALGCRPAAIATSGRGEASDERCATSGTLDVGVSESMGEHTARIHLCWCSLADDGRDASPRWS